MNNDCSLFARLYIVCQAHDGNLNDFFKHENQASPPSLSQNGALRKPTEADILGCLEKEVNPPQHEPQCDVFTFDGGALVNMLKPIT